MKLINKWIGYLQRSSDTAEASVMAKWPTAIPEITDRSNNNPLIKIQRVWFAILELINYYADNAGREAFISVARYFKSGVRAAKGYDYRVKGAGAATADVTFTTSGPLPAPLTIAAGTELQTPAGTRLFTTEELIIGTGESTGTVSVEQAVPSVNTAIGTSDESADQRFVINVNSPFAVADGSVTITVNAEQWEPVQTFAFSGPTDKHFIAGLNEAGEMEILFGDDENGAIPAAFDIIASYKITGGITGNLINENSITIIVPVLIIPGGLTLTVTNPNRASGGFAKQTLKNLQKKLPLFLRTLEVAVRKNDYKEVAMLAPGVAQAGVYYNCGKYVDIYISAEGGGLPSGALLENTQIWMDEAIIMTTKVKVKAAGITPIRIEAELYLYDGSPAAATSLAVQNKLLDLLSAENQEIYGSVEQGDIYEILETWNKGVKFSRLKVMQVIPYGRPLNDTSPELNWEPEIQPESAETVRWGMVFVNGNTFQLLKNGSLIGTYTTGVEIVLPEVVFTVNDVYAAGNTYEFYTYKSFGTVELSEPSYILGLAENIKLSTIGGV